jgi:putative peptide zinc metalloprotease protein
MERIRADLKIIPQDQNGTTTYIVKDPVQRQYFRFGPVEYAVVRQLNGLREPEEVARLASVEIGRTLPAGTVRQFLGSLRKLGLLERTLQEKSLALLERLRDERRQRVRAAGGRSLLHMRFPVWDPDLFYNRVIGRVGFLWLPASFAVYLSLFAAAAVILLSHWSTVRQGMTQLHGFAGKGPADIALLMGMVWIILFLHENGHGLTCKRFGGEVHEIGFLLVYLLPAFYANVSDVWVFESRRAKLAVTFAGIFVELLICSVAAIVWQFSTPVYGLHDLAFQCMLVAGLSSILMNMNPLIRMDGYYALMDALNIPNLNDEAMRQVRGLLFHTAETSTVHPRRRILLTYGIAALIYRTVLIGGILLWVYRRSEQSFGAVGICVFAIGSLWGLQRIVRRAWPALQHVRRLRLVLAGAALASIACLIPLPQWYVTPFLVEPAERVPVRAESEGFVQQVKAWDGATVRAGETLAILRNPEIEHRCEALRKRVALAERQTLLAQAHGEVAQAHEARRHREALQTELEMAERDAARLTVRAPAGGVLLTPRMEEKYGTLLRRGENLCELAKAGPRRIRVLVDDWHLKRIAPGAPARIWPESMPFRPLEARLTRIAPASSLHAELAPAADLSTEAPLARFTGYLEVTGDAPELRPGSSGEAKIYEGSEPLAVTAARNVWEWFRSKLWW